MAEGSCNMWHCLSLLGLALFLMFYELACFVGFLSLSIGVGAGLKLLVKYVLSIQIHVSLETFVTWYCLACSTELHLRLFKKCVYPKVREKIRNHPNVLLGLPRVIYFVLYCLAIFGIFYEYEAYSSAYQCKTNCESESPRERLNEINKRNMNRSNNSPTHLNSSSANASASRNSLNGNMDTHNANDMRLIALPLMKKSYENEHPVADLSLTEEVEKEKVATAIFLMFMSYLIYATGQIICGFLMRINRGIPANSLACPQVYATCCMMVLQVILTVFYSLPILMFLGACYCFYVDGDTTYMFTLCVATSISMAAAHLELESLFPRETAFGPFYWFESLQRSRVNIVFILLFPVAHYFFQRSSNRNYPLNARDPEFIRFCFWFFVCLMHCVKTLYLTTADPRPRVIVAQHPENHELIEPDDDVPDQRMRNHPDYPRPSAQENPQSLIPGNNNNNNSDENGTDDAGKNLEESPSQNNSREKLEEGLSITKNDPDHQDHNLPNKKKKNSDNESSIYSTVSETTANSTSNIITNNAHSSTSKNNNSNNNTNVIIMNTSQPVDKAEIENVFKEIGIPADKIIITKQDDDCHKNYKEEDVLNNITATTKKKSESEIKIIS